MAAPKQYGSPLICCRGLQGRADRVRPPERVWHARPAMPAARARVAAAMWPKIQAGKLVVSRGRVWHLRKKHCRGPAQQCRDAEAESSARAKTQSPAWPDLAHFARFASLATGLGSTYSLLAKVIHLRDKATG